MILPQRRLSHAQGYLALGMIAEAARELEQLSGPFADSTPVLVVRVGVLHEQEKWPEVRDFAREWVRRQPEEPAGWISWAYATRRADTLEEAENILRQAEVRHPKEATIQFNLGCYACLRGDLREARSRVDRAIALDVNYDALAATDPDLAALRAMERADCQPQG